MAIKYLSGYQAVGTAAERTAATWTGTPTGYKFFETDTGLEYYWNGTTWAQAGGAGTPNEPYSYYIFKSGSTYYAKNGATKAIDSSNSDAATVIQAAITALTGLGGTIVLARNTAFTLATPLVLPQSDNTNVNQWNIKGDHSSFFDNTATTLQPTNSSGTWTGRSMIECIPSLGSAKRSALRCSGINFYNPWMATFPVGGIDLRSDTNTRFGNIFLNDLNFRYIDKGINLSGYAYHSIIRDCNFTDASSSYSGTYALNVEQGGYPDKPDFCLFDNLHTSFSGTNVNEFIFETNYSTISNVITDGWTYSNCPFKVINSNANLFYRIGGTDLNGASGTATSALYLTANGSFTTKGNRFLKMIMVPYPPSGTRRTVYIDNSAVTNNYIEFEHFGSNNIIIDETAGSQNVFAMLPGYHAGFTQAKPTILNMQATSRIIDNRAGAYTTGVSTQSGNASTTAFNIAHNCFTTPLTYSVTPQTVDARGSPIVTATSTNLVVTYPVAPPTGSSNLTWVWTAGVY